MAIRVLNGEIKIFNFSLRHFVRHFHATRRQILAHALGRIRIEGDMAELAILLARIGGKLDCLIVINLHERKADASVIALQIVRLGEPKKVLVKTTRLLQIADVKVDMRDTKNPRPHRSIRSAKRQSKTKQQNKSGDSFHTVPSADEAGCPFAASVVRDGR